MNTLEKCKLAIELGFTYDPETGKIFGIRGKEIKSKFTTGYIKIIHSKFEFKGHQFAWYWVHKECVDNLDHINGIRDDNRICNLRSVSHQQNQWNHTKAKGFYWDKKANKWKAQIGLNYKKIYLGLFDSEEDAREAYKKAKEIYHQI